jgi:hypothetical protein
MRSGFSQRGDRGIQIAVLGTQQLQPFAKLLFVHAALS